MKKIISLALALFIFVFFAFSLSACGVTPPEVCTQHVDENNDGICDNEGCGEAVAPTPDDGGESTNYFNENGELILYSAGVPTFKIVKGAGYSGGKIIDDLATLLSGISASEVKSVKATDAEEIQDVEIIIGTVTNRGDEYKFDIHTLGLEGYIVKQVGTKIFVVAGSEDYYQPAINYLKTTVFGLTRNPAPFTDLVMESGKNKEAIQDNYPVKDVTIDGVSMRGYSLTYENGDNVSKSLASNIQETLYEKTGIWLPVLRSDRLENGAPYISLSLIENDGEGGGFYFNIDENKNATIQCEFANKYESLVLGFFEEKIFASGIKGKVKLENYNPDFRNVTYEGYGAKGDGETNDFEAIKAAHEDANINKLIVHATAGKTYYIGTKRGRVSITVMTDTYWHGASFIFDDYGLLQSDPEYGTPIFHIAPSVGTKAQYDSTDIPITSLDKGATNIGFAPGYDAYIRLENANKRQYIRYGTWADAGSPMKEHLFVHADGTIDESTPVQWDFTEATHMYIYEPNDAPIVISGADTKDQKAKITTIFNGSPFPEVDRYLAARIYVTRSNVKIERIEHCFTGEDDVESGQPYNGFIGGDSCMNLEIRDIIFQRPKRWQNTVSGKDMSRSYEIRMGGVTNILFEDCDQSNFFHDPNTGLNANNGMMGTNYCRNMMLNRCNFNTFDAHCGVYNATIKNSTLVYVSIIGAGVLEVDNVTFYAARTDRADAIAIWMRDDYGSTFDGDFILKNINIKYNKFNNNEREIGVIDATWINHYFGYDTTLPHNIYLENINATKIDVTVENGVRKETVVSVNKDKINIFTSKVGNRTDDITRPGNNPITGAAGGDNPYAGPDNIYIKDCENRVIGRPTAPQFASTKYYVYNPETEQYELDN